MAYSPSGVCEPELYSLQVTDLVSLSHEMPRKNILIWIWEKQPLGENKEMANSLQHIH